MEEEWRDVVGYEGLYLVSNKGRIKSLFKGTRIYDTDGTILRPSRAKDGYERVVLYDGKGGRLSKTVHKIVAMAFIPNPNGYEAINHKDECKDNNTVENLEWCTVRHNNRYGTARIRQSMHSGRAVAQVNNYGFVVAQYRNVNIAKSITGINNIDKCCRNIEYKSGGYFWRYIDNFTDENIPIN